MPVSNTKLLRTRFPVVGFGIWWLFWSILHYKVLSNFGIVFTESASDSLISNILLAAFCLLIVNNMRYYLPGKERYWYVLLLSFILSVIWLAVSRGILWLIFKQDPVYTRILSLSSNIRFAFGFLMTGCVTMLSLIWYTQKEQKATTELKQEAENHLREAELFKLRQQLQPHFLFNSLNSISALAGSQPEKARHMIQQLSAFLRGTLKKEERQMIPLQEEIGFLELYLEIEKVRFGNRLQTDIQVTEEAATQLIPALILQPIVENAIKFGLYDTMDEVRIVIHASQTQSGLEVTVSNPFDPETSAGGQGTGFGLASVQRRLFLLYSRNGLLETSVTQNIFTTLLTIPS